MPSLFYTCRRKKTKGDKEGRFIQNRDLSIIDDMIKCSIFVSPHCHGYFWICPCLAKERRVQYKHDIDADHTAHTSTLLITPTHAFSPCSRFSFLMFRLLISALIADIWQQWREWFQISFYYDWMPPTNVFIYIFNISKCFNIILFSLVCCQNRDVKGILFIWCLCVYNTVLILNMIWLLLIPSLFSYRSGLRPSVEDSDIL